MPDVQGFPKNGKTVVVSGGTDGIGRAVVMKLLSDGYSVVAFGLNALQKGSVSAGSVDRLRSDLLERSTDVLVEELDVRDSQSITDLADRVSTRFGSVHGLVNCAGIRLPGPFAEVSADQLRASLEVNVIGLFNCCKAFTPLMTGVSTPASIVNIGSAAGWGRPDLLAYSTSKSALFGLSQALSYDLRSSRVRVNTIVPGGGIRSGMTESMGLTDDDFASAGRRSVAGREVDGADVADAVLFLLSPQAAQISGAVLNVGGNLNQAGPAWYK